MHKETDVILNSGDAYTTVVAVRLSWHLWVTYSREFQQAKTHQGL